MRRRVAVVVGVVVIAIALLAWRALREDRPVRRRATATSRLDVAAFRAELALRVKRAKAIAARRRAEPAEAEPTEKPRSKAWAMLGSGAWPYQSRWFLETPCRIGPLEACGVLGPIVDECDGGDARSCIALGQYLADNPPRTLFARLFFEQACRLGDPAGCERLDDLEPGASRACEDDPWACSARATGTDLATHEEACTLGAADSCVAIGSESEDLAEKAAYYETACQLGDLRICSSLATLLSPECDEDRWGCLPIDEEGAARAREMACAAGHSKHCETN